MVFVTRVLLWSLLAFLCGSGICAPQVATLVLLPDAAAAGAVCLDGSPPGYYYRPGSGTDTDKWIVHLQGGGWCFNEDLCVERSKTALGSSKFWPPRTTFGGFLSDDDSVNPDFANWNVAFVQYCDGASFAGNVPEPVVWNGTKLYFRGWRILQEVMTALISSGMSNASDVILTGCSAGGLATYIHADTVASYLHPGVKYRAMADAGYFIDAPNVSGQLHIRSLYQSVFKMQNASDGVNQDCVKHYGSVESWRCFFPQYTWNFIKSPLFQLNSQYDTWQLAGILQLKCLPPNCNSTQMEYFNKFRDEFLQAASDPIATGTAGQFLDSCLVHCQSLADTFWVDYKVFSQSIRDTFSDWYFMKTSTTKEVDCAFPCNPTCPVS